MKLEDVVFQAGINCLDQLKQYVPPFQRASTLETLKGEDGPAVLEELQRMAGYLHKWPGDDMAVFHLFVGGCDWLVMERADTHNVAFGWANLGDPQCAEYGSLWLPEILQASPLVNIDYFWEPRPAAEAVQYLRNR